MLHPHFEDWLADVLSSEPLTASLLEGQAVSVCGSVRISREAHEAGVETAEEFRGRGYAGQTVAAWANAVHRIGRIPLYSTSWRNTSSQAVAAKLGLVRFGTDLHIA